MTPEQALEATKAVFENLDPPSAFCTPEAMREYLAEKDRLRALFISRGGDPANLREPQPAAHYRPTAFRGAPSAAAQAKAAGDDSEPLATPDKETLALVALHKHPDWTNRKIAEAVGCNRTTLYTFKRFMAAREILKQGKNDLPRGSKYPEENIEAWDNEGDG